MTILQLALWLFSIFPKMVYNNNHSKMHWREINLLQTLDV